MLAKIILFLIVVLLGCSHGLAADTILVALARDVALQHTTLIKSEAGSEYTGHYNGSHAGCDYVSIKRVWMPDFRSRSRIDLHNFKYCGGELVTIGESLHQMVPDSAREYTSAIAKACQQRGTAEYSFDDVLILCMALRDRGMCSVEVNTLIDEKLIDSTIVNGCR